MFHIYTHIICQIWPCIGVRTSTQGIMKFYNFGRGLSVLQDISYRCVVIEKITENLSILLTFALSLKGPGSECFLK